MSRVVLIHRSEKREIAGVQLVNKCTLFKNNLALLALPYTINSTVTSEVFQQFVVSLDDKPIEITNANFMGLSRLCEEFGYEDLTAKLSQFRESGDFLDFSGIENVKICPALVDLVRRVVSDAFQKTNGEVLSKFDVLNNHISTLETRFYSLFPPSMDSHIIKQFPIEILSEFKANRFVLLWRGTRDGFQAKIFHERCDGHSNTLTIIEDVHGYIFGGFTPISWDSSDSFKADLSGRSFLFTLKNPTGTVPMKFALSLKDRAIRCTPLCGPGFGSNCDLIASDNCNLYPASRTNLGGSYTNSTGRDSTTVFT
jgi:hypothetical protein